MAKRVNSESVDADSPQERDDPIAGQPDHDADADWGEISLEELGQAYADAMAEVMGLDDSPDAASTGPGDSSASSAGERDAADEVVDTVALTSPVATVEDEDEDDVPTPLAIIEAALFIGNPENRGISEAELASLMRDVTAEDVSQYVDRLNESYIAHGQAFRIHRDEDGLRLGVAPDMEVVRRAFYGKIRETRLSQPAIEVLSLVAYQPGITAEKVQDQRGKESASLLSQLVRRRLLEQRRVAVPDSKKMIATYHPTERFLQLFGLQSLDDLPHVEA